MDPYYNPINFLESVDTTTGTKTLEEYTLEGAMAYSLNDRLTLAGKVSYQSADYAKRKDPRSYSQWMRSGRIGRGKIFIGGRENRLRRQP